MALALVLLVDDDIAALASAWAVLSGAGYAVEESASGREALERVMANPPDVLITEILMPDGDGIELISAIKRPWPDMRIIAVTERRFLRGLDLLALAGEVGADAILEKPLKTEQLLGAVARLMAEMSANRRSSRQALSREAGATDPPPPENCSLLDPR